MVSLTQGPPTWCPRDGSENRINMISVFTLMNIFNFY